MCRNKRRSWVGADHELFVALADPERGLLTDPTAADEERQYGRVPRRLYLVYAQSCGLLLTLAYFIGSFAWQGARLFTDYWLVIYQIEDQQQQQQQQKQEHPFALPNETQDFSKSANYYLVIYVGLSVASIATALLTNVLGQASNIAIDFTANIKKPID